MTRPWLTIATRSHSRSTSPRRCELRKTAEPRSRASRMIARTSSRPTGSRADVGSSRITRAGSPSSAAASPRRCCMPFEKPPVRSSARSARPASPRTRSISCPPALRRQARQLGVQHQDLVGREPGLVAEQLGEVADAPARLAVPDRSPEHLAVARGPPRQPEEQLDGGGLARAVRPEEAEHLAGLDAQVERLEPDGVPVHLAQALGLDGGGHGCILTGPGRFVRSRL